MHHIYHTHGFVLSSRNVGEANKILTVYTRELGLVNAVVQGVRLDKSKLRFSLQDFSYSEIDFVRGKDIWRITSARHISSFPYIRSDKLSFLFMAKISSLIDRLCAGEDPNESIFDDFIQSMSLLDDVEVEASNREALELHLVLRIMNSLGYIGESEMLASYLNDKFDKNKIEILLKDKKSIISHINKALSESQL